MIKLIILNNESINPQLEGNTETYEGVVAKIEANDYILVTDAVARQLLIDDSFPIELLKIQSSELFKNITGLNEGWLVAYQ